MKKKELHTEQAAHPRSIIASAWLDSVASLTDQDMRNMSKNCIAKCYNKVKQKAKVHICARAKTFLSMKMVCWQISLFRIIQWTVIFFMPSYVLGEIWPHIVLIIVFSLHYFKLNQCDITVFSVKVSSCSNSLEWMALFQSHEAINFLAAFFSTCHEADRMGSL